MASTNIIRSLVSLYLRCHINCFRKQPLPIILTYKNLNDVQKTTISDVTEIYGMSYLEVEEYSILAFDKDYRIIEQFGGLGTVIHVNDSQCLTTLCELFSILSNEEPVAELKDLVPEMYILLPIHYEKENKELAYMIMDLIRNPAKKILSVYECNNEFTKYLEELLFLSDINTAPKPKKEIVLYNKKNDLSSEIQQNNNNFTNDRIGLARESLNIRTYILATNKLAFSMLNLLQKSFSDKIKASNFANQSIALQHISRQLNSIIQEWAIQYVRSAVAKADKQQQNSDKLTAFDIFIKDVSKLDAEEPLTKQVINLDIDMYFHHVNSKLETLVHEVISTNNSTERPLLSSNEIMETNEVISTNNSTERPLLSSNDILEVKEVNSSNNEIMEHSTISLDVEMYLQHVNSKFETAVQNVISFNENTKKPLLTSNEILETFGIQDSEVQKQISQAIKSATKCSKKYENQLQEIKEAKYRKCASRICKIVHSQNDNNANMMQPQTVENENNSSNIIITNTDVQHGPESTSITKAVESVKELPQVLDEKQKNDSLRNEEVSNVTPATSEASTPVSMSAGSHLPQSLSQTMEPTNAYLSNSNTQNKPAEKVIGKSSLAPKNTNNKGAAEFYFKEYQTIRRLKNIVQQISEKNISSSTC